MLPLQGKSILIVEDEYLIALDIAEVLEKAGATTAIAETPDKAMGVLKSGGISAVILVQTASIKAGHSVGDTLEMLGVPYIIYSGGVSASQLDKDVPRISKPSADSIIVMALQRAMLTSDRWYG